MSDQNVKLLYENLHRIMVHFAEGAIGKQGIVSFRTK